MRHKNENTCINNTLTKSTKMTFIAKTFPEDTQTGGGKDFSIQNKFLFFAQTFSHESSK